MRVRRIKRWLVLLAAIPFLFPHISQPTSLYALGNPCAFDPNNLIANGYMREGGLSPYGPVADRWNAFVMSGEPPLFNWVDNEGIDPEGSQYIEADKPFDAGIYQVVRNLQPGAYYHLWVGYALAAYDNGDTVNRRYDEIGRMVGVDATGGTDPHASTVQWGPEYRDGKRALNIPDLSGNVVAQADHITVFVRAINHSSVYRNKVWFDSICMEARPDLGVATLAATGTATVTVTVTPMPATDTPAPTNTSVAAPAAAVEASPTRVAASRTATRTPRATRVPPTDTPEPSSTPAPTESLGAEPSAAQKVAQANATSTNTPKPTSTPRRRATSAVSTETSASTGTNAVSMAVLAGSFGLIGLSSLGFVTLGAFLFWKFVLNRA